MRFVNTVLVHCVQFLTASLQCAVIRFFSRLVYVHCTVQYCTLYSTVLYSVGSLFLGNKLPNVLLPELPWNWLR